ncbi:jg1746 [Pararge aegeria aegeria]|uniref:Jg1746 protein n=1 Tax=Pararge aegeria aegeria TaxID=348720 RepID=A0A8S4SNB1_9NEOP|nr:jg1746 [Pararge aegeria aegeria]
MFLTPVRCLPGADAAHVLRVRMSEHAHVRMRGMLKRYAIECMEADERPTHVFLRCRGVPEQRAAYLGSPASLPEALGDLGCLISFSSELGWLE